MSQAQRKELAEKLNRVEKAINSINNDLDRLRMGSALPGTSVVTASLEGFDSDEGSIILSVDPPTLCEPGKASVELKGSMKMAQFVVSSFEGTIGVKAMMAGKETEIGSWKLEACPINEDICLGTQQDDTQVVHRLKVVQATAESLAATIADKEAKSKELYEQRKQLKGEMAELNKRKEKNVAKPTPASISWSKSLLQRLVLAPVGLFNICSMVLNSPLKELLLFGGGVALLKYKGEDLAI
mmetsp:Transcript_24584/g.55393  ORF Transcript_24584/g.55393 Transcript_24584/m.55393 type:complete len:241 (+) Transcript_24584:73-795(+)|eukprot:CAMPEP_0172648490 /NCGR_PEP_ID=MMETSP1068-20121228/241297_1 /TAXON_ID=35684 /ORGANISM="Pseudopedinella elastica, Strain CCMP716" /LENGTH=240 /DNA_ID=CAMNT_0013462811 /DNA_START=55 /DNA_END=777 /DNA_ORIENTATION=-